MCPSPKNKFPSLLVRCNKSPPILKKSTFSSTSNDDDSISSSTASLSECTVQQSTSFSTVEIRQYPITLSNNPGGGQGPPICLDWRHDEEKTQVIGLDDYEEERPPRRDEIEMYMPEYLRRWRLLERGVSMKEMRKATKDANCVRQQRKASIRPQKKLSLNCGRQQRKDSIQPLKKLSLGLKGRVEQLIARRRKTSNEKLADLISNSLTSSR